MFYVLCSILNSLIAFIGLVGTIVVINLLIIRLFWVCVCVCAVSGCFLVIVSSDYGRFIWLLYRYYSFDVCCFTFEAHCLIVQVSG